MDLTAKTKPRTVDQAPAVDERLCPATGGAGHLVVAGGIGGREESGGGGVGNGGGGGSDVGGSSSGSSGAEEPSGRPGGARVTAVASSVEKSATPGFERGKMLDGGFERGKMGV